MYMYVVQRSAGKLQCSITHAVMTSRKTTQYYKSVGNLSYHVKHCTLLHFRDNIMPLYMSLNDIIWADVVKTQNSLQSCQKLSLIREDAVFSYDDYTSSKS
jgi:predicted  nucleic acid-binding Zn ribbon protein